MSGATEPGFRTARGYRMFDQENGRLSPALEDYLEMIYRLCKDRGYTRVGKISECLQVKPSSASKMIVKLAGMEYIRYGRYEIIQLTESGKKLGSYFLARHNILTEFLKLIGSKNTLEEVELIEHPLTAATVSNLKILIDFFRLNPEIEKKFRIYRSKQFG
jgi:Mn-dependent DtxR family transcriptional regulator